MTSLEEVLSDLTAESLQVDQWVAGLTVAQWATVTTPEGWTVTDQVAHLHWTDTAAIAALHDPDAFGRMMLAAAQDPTGFVDTATAELALVEPGDLLLLWREGRVELDAALREVPDGERIPWFGPPMSSTSMARARLMETWAHAHDIGEGLGLTIPPSSRVRHVCHLGVRTRDFAHLVRDEPVPDVEIRVELTGPDGDLWTWGPEDAPERVTGRAWDFALLATRRRHLDDVDVHAEGEHAAHWLTIAQAFAGGPGTDPVRLADRA